MKNEAVRMMLAISALTLTALLTSPDARWGSNGKIIAEKSMKPKPRVESIQLDKKSKASRSFAFFFRK